LPGINHPLFYPLKMRLRKNAGEMGQGGGEEV
jgi:hypothetical protein